METLAAFQEDFARALTSAEPDARPAGFNEEAGRRFRVYRNNVYSGLSQTLADAYPVVRRLVGDAFFFAAARLFLADHLPRTRSLALYGGAFPDFLEGFEPARSVPYLSDVARLERMRLEALHAADAAPLDPHALSGTGETLVDLRLVPHPAARLLRSPFPVVSIWTANSGERPPAGRCIYRGAEAALVTRAYLDVGMVTLDPGAAAFVAALIDGAPIGAAAADALQTDPAFDVAAIFHRLLTAGAFTRIADGGITR